MAEEPMGPGLPTPSEAAGETDADTEAGRGEGLDEIVDLVAEHDQYGDEVNRENVVTRLRYVLSCYRENLRRLRESDPGGDRFGDECPLGPHQDDEWPCPHCGGGEEPRCPCGNEKPIDAYLCEGCREQVAAARRHRRASPSAALEVAIRWLDKTMTNDPEGADYVFRVMCEALGIEDAQDLDRDPAAPTDEAPEVERVEALAAEVADWTTDELVEWLENCAAYEELEGYEYQAALYGEVIDRLSSPPPPVEEGERGELRDTLERYGQHHGDCYWLDPDRPAAGCNCGWQQRVQEMGLDVRLGVPPLEKPGLHVHQQEGGAWIAEIRIPGDGHGFARAENDYAAIRDALVDAVKERAEKGSAPDARGRQ